MLPGERGGTIKDIYAHLDAGKETGAVSGFGSFIYKDTTVRYSLESGSVTATGGAESFPVALTLTSRPFRARLSGTASNTAGFAIDGDMQAEIDDGRRFFKWIGIRIPDGDSLKGFSAAGGFHLAGSTLTFDDGTFTLDGNKAVGLLALTAGDPRPRVEGTLAFDRLVLDPYLGSASAESRQAARSARRPSPSTGLSCNSSTPTCASRRRQSKPARLSSAVAEFTITAKQGSVASEVGELELCGGSADGRLNVDLAQAKKQINLVANLADISLDACLEPLALALPIRGTGTLKTELASEGTDFSQLTGNLAGTLKLEAKDGAVPVDFARLATGSTPISAEGWSRDDVTAFDQLDADCQLGSGHIWCQSVSMQTPRGTIAGSGDVDVSKQTLDLSLTLANRIEPARASQPTQGEAPKVSIRGSLAQPTIRRADRPTLGEGSLQTNPVGPQVSPR